MTSKVRLKEKARVASPFQGCRARHKGARGFTYLYLLMLIAVQGVGIAAISEVWTRTAQMEQKSQSDWEQQQILVAIKSFYYAAPPDKRMYPNNINQLTEDNRFFPPLRHLRYNYLQHHPRWTVIQTNEGIQGIRLSNDVNSPPVEYRVKIHVGKN